jgi:photosystem II stability/assembly factor-like uncharacterized protein
MPTEPRSTVFVVFLLTACAAPSDEDVDDGGSTTPAVDDGDDGGASATPGDSTGADDSVSSDGSPGSDDDADASSDGGSDSGGPVSVACDDRPPVADAPAPQWINATGTLAGMPSECGNLTLVSAKPCSTSVIAGVAHGGLHATDDGGQSWAPLGTGAGSAVITNRPAAIVYDPEHPEVFWEAGIYNDGGVYRTDDGGLTFTQLGTFGHNDLVSVGFADPERKTLLAGGHEQKQRLMLSTDGGVEWTDVGPNLPADSHFSSAPLVVDASTFLLGACGWGDGTCGIFRSTDTGASWAMVSDLPAYGEPRWASDGSIYWSLVYNGGVARSVDQGVTWTKPAEGLGGTPVELPDGRILMLGGDHVVVSADGGGSWTPIGDPLPFAAVGLAFSAQSKTLYVWHNDCGEVVLPDAIMSAGFDPE